MSFRLVCVGAASLLCLFASASSSAEPTRRESAIAAAAASDELLSYPRRKTHKMAMWDPSRWLGAVRITGRPLAY